LGDLFFGSARKEDPMPEGTFESSVCLAPYDPRWPAMFEAERARLQAAVGPDAPIAHIGSTSVPGLTAKPYIDMLVGHGDGVDEAACLAALLGLGYVEEGARPGHRWLCWPTPALRTFIVHLVPAGGSVWQARLSFRDRLRQSPALRDAYAALKHELAEPHVGDLSAYTAAKFPFVRSVLEGS
jgi:GrpB-like predicted nucleotidyltransferase (UPF0157 family)